MINVILWLFLVGDVIGSLLMIRSVGKPRILKKVDAILYLVLESIVWVALILKLMN